MNDPIQILTLADANYFLGLRVTALSMAIFAKDPSRLVFNVIDGGIQESQQQDLERRLQEVHPQIQVRFIQPAEKWFQDFPAYKGNKLTYSRLFLPEIFPDMGKILFCDSDTLWLAPVEDLWSLMQKDDAIVAVKDPMDATRESENSWFEQNGLEPPGEAYFCAAIAMLNLKWMRAHRVIERAGVFVAAYPDLRFADQTIMNHLMRGHVCDMPTYLHTISRTEHRGSLDLPRTLHYAGELPWVRTTRSGTISDMEMIWHHFSDLAIYGKQGASLAQLYPRHQIWLKRFIFKLNAIPGIRCVFQFLGQKVLRLNDASLEKLLYVNPIERSAIKKVFKTIETTTDRRCKLSPRIQLTSD